MIFYIIICIFIFQKLKEAVQKLNATGIADFHEALEYAFHEFSKVSQVQSLEKIDNFVKSNYYFVKIGIKVWFYLLKIATNIWSNNKLYKSYGLGVIVMLC